MTFLYDALQASWDSLNQSAVYMLMGWAGYGSSIRDGAW